MQTFENLFINIADLLLYVSAYHISVCCCIPSRFLNTNNPPAFTKFTKVSYEIIGFMMQSFD